MLQQIQSTNPKDKIGVTKPPLHLIPASALIHESMAMKNGAEKYGPYNWRQHSVAASVYIAAVYRHIAAWFDGEDYAMDSNVHHLAHARACLGILLDAESVKKLVDDRPTKGNTSELIYEFTTPKGQLKMAGFPSTVFLGQNSTVDLSEHENKELKPTVYLSGPMRGIPDNNFPAFDKVRDTWKAWGFDVISPADMDREQGFGDNLVYAKRDLKALLDLAENNPTKKNGIVLLSGWEKSIGAKAELFVALWIGLPVHAQSGEVYRGGAINVRHLINAIVEQINK